MIFKKLKLNYFGRFHDREIELKPGINLIYGENEAGKSTVHTFIKGMLFGIERLRGRGAATKEDLYTRYLPWDYPGAFSGQMDIQLGGKDYRLQRSFHANDKVFTILDLETGREVKLKEDLISGLIPGLTESTFKNTVSIEQLKAQTDAELASQVRNYIANLSIAKSSEVNVAKAVTLLTEKRKALETAINAPELKSLQAEIEEGIDKEERIDELTLKLRALITEEQELKVRKETAAASMDNEASEMIEQLPAILEKYRSFKELMSQKLTLDKQIEELKSKIILWEKEAGTSDALKDDIKEATGIITERPELENKYNLLNQGRDQAYKTNIRNNIIICLAPALILGLLSFIIWGLSSGLLITGGALLLGSLLAAVLNKAAGDKKKKEDIKLNELKLRITDLNNRLKELLNKHNVLSIEELNNKQEDILKLTYSLEHGREQLKELSKRHEEAEDRCDLLSDTILKYMQYFIASEELSDNNVQRLKEIIQHKKLETSQKQSELNRLYDSCRFQIERLRGEISTMEGNEEKLLKNKERYAELLEQQKENAVELEAVKLALGTIQSLSADIHDSFGKQLNAAVSAVISGVTDSKYTDLKVDEKLDVKVGLNDNYVLLDRLSAGTMDQIYFALRLAVADLLLGKDELPLVLDDSFALYDDNRVKAALKYIAGRKQILLFSCHNREKRLLEEMKLPYNFVDLSCR